MKIVEKNENVFTKNRKNIIMNKDYNPLNKDRCFYERKGLLMMNKLKESILVILKEDDVDEEVVKSCYNICKYYKKELNI